MLAEGEGLSVAKPDSANARKQSSNMHSGDQFVRTHSTSVGATLRIAENRLVAIGAVSPSCYTLDALS